MWELAAITLFFNLKKTLLVQKNHQEGENVPLPPLGEKKEKERGSSLQLQGGTATQAFRFLPQIIAMLSGLQLRCVEVLLLPGDLHPLLFECCSAATNVSLETAPNS